MFNRTPRTRFLFFLISDFILIALSVYLSFFLRFDFTIPPQYREFIPSYIAILLIVLIPLFYLHRLYHFTWVYVGINNLIAIFKATAYGFLLIGLLLFLYRNNRLSTHLPRAIILLDFFLVFIFVGGLRISKRLYLELKGQTIFDRGRDDKPNVIIIGAGDAAEQLIRNIKTSADYPFTIVGLLDDSAIKRGTAIHDVPVLGKISDLSLIHKKLNLHGIIIALPSASSQEIKAIADLAQTCGISYVKTIPSLMALMERRVTAADVRDLRVEDLLGRQKIDVSYDQIENLVNGKTILVTGASGSIGFELVKQLSRLSPKFMVCVDNDETGVFTVERFFSSSQSPVQYAARVANVCNKIKMRELFAEYRPDIVFHAAAYKHVKLMELETDEAILNNILGTWNVADAAREYGAKKFVLISTDKAVRPQSVMGMSKRIAELITLCYNGAINAVAVRFGNVLGSRGSVVPIFKEQILSGGPVTVTHPDMERYFMVPSEAILLVLQAAALGDGAEIFVLDMGRPVKILQLAETMIKLAGFEPYKDIPIVFTKPEEGEKLFEEMFSNKENMLATKNASIFIAPSSPPSNPSKFFASLEELISLAKSGSKEMIKTNLAQIIAEFGTS